jgi:hypothetical protein
VNEKMSVSVTFRKTWRVAKFLLGMIDKTADWIKRRSSWLYTDFLLQKSYSFSAADCFRRSVFSLSP